MKKKTLRTIKYMLHDNRGAGFFMVIVGALFLTILGFTIIYAAYTSYNVKMSAKRSNSAFYVADTALEEIRTGLQKVVSDSAAAGYENALTNSSSDTSQTELFMDAYTDCFTGYQYDGTDTYGNPEKKSLFMTDSFVGGRKITGIYCDGIRSFIAPALNNEKLTISSLGSPDNTTTVACDQDEKGTVTIQGLKVEYTEAGYTSYVTTDVRLSIPDIELAGLYDFGGLENFVLIADDGLSTFHEGDSPQPLRIGANARGFFGSIDIKGKRGLVMGENSRVIVGDVNRDSDSDKKALTTPQEDRGKIKIEDHGKLTLKDGAQLFAKDIELTGDASLNKDPDNPPGTGCKYFIADDLSLEGSSTAVIRGSYKGFGDGSTDSESALSANYSSSILFPRRFSSAKAALDLTDCGSMELSGNTFIMDGAGDNPSEVGMGSSFSTQREQLIYLIPSEFLGGKSNPSIVQELSEADQMVKVDGEIAGRLGSTPLFNVDGVNKYASDYGISVTGDRRTSGVTYLKYTLGSSGWGVYYFFRFPTKAYANSYFRDYFSSGKGRIEDYIKDYASIKGDSSRIFAAGTAVLMNEDGSEAEIVDASSLNLSASSAELKKVFKNLSQSMSENVSDEGNTPFYHLVDAEKLRDVVRNPESYDKNKVADPDDGNKYYEFTDETATDPDICYRYVRCAQGVNTYDGYYIIADDSIYLAEDIPGADPSKNVVTTNVNTARLIICDGDVYLGGEWNGLIICSGRIYYSKDSKVTLDSEVPSEYKASKIFTDESGFYRGGSDVADSNDWSLNDLVTFSNWKKNED